CRREGSGSWGRRNCRRPLGPSWLKSPFDRRFTLLASSSRRPPILPFTPRLDQEIPDAHTCRPHSPDPAPPRPRPVIFLVALLFAVAASGPQATPSAGVVISQVYGGGGNANAPFQND